MTTRPKRPTLAEPVCAKCDADETVTPGLCECRACPSSGRLIEAVAVARDFVAATQAMLDRVGADYVRACAVAAGVQECDVSITSLRRGPEVSWQSDNAITPRLTVTLRLDGSPFLHGGLVQLYGITGFEWDYFEELSVDQTRHLIKVLQEALRLRDDT